MFIVWLVLAASCVYIVTKIMNDLFDDCLNRIDHLTLTVAALKKKIEELQKEIKNNGDGV